MKLSGMNQKIDRQLTLGDRIKIFRNPGMIPYTADVIWIDRGHRFCVLRAKEKELA